MLLSRLTCHKLPHSWAWYQKVSEKLLVIHLLALTIRLWIVTIAELSNCEFWVFIYFWIYLHQLPLRGLWESNYIVKFDFSGFAISEIAKLKFQWKFSSCMISCGLETWLRTCEQVAVNVCPFTSLLTLPSFFFSAQSCQSAHKIRKWGG